MKYIKWTSHILSYTDEQQFENVLRLLFILS